MKKSKILIVEDYAALADNLGRLCKIDDLEPLVVYTGSEALKIVDSYPDLDLAVLDINLPDISGFDVCRYIRKRSDIPIIIMTSRTTDVDFISGLEMGGDTYLKKPIEPREVVAQIRTFLRRIGNSPKKKEGNNGLKESNPYNKLHPAIRIDENARKIFIREDLVPLTNLEYSTITIMFRKPGQVFSKVQIMTLSSDDTIITEKAIEKRMNRIKKKFKKIAPDIEIIETCPGIGYRIIPYEH